LIKAAKKALVEALTWLGLLIVVPVVLFAEALNWFMEWLDND